MYLPHLAGSGVTVRCVRDRDRETKAEVNKAMASPMMRTFDLRKEEICEKAETAERDQQRKKGRKTIYMRAKSLERAGNTRKRVVVSDDGRGDPENKKNKSE